jgi:hypothetical protein
MPDPSVLYLPCPTGMPPLSLGPYIRGMFATCLTTGTEVVGGIVEVAARGLLNCDRVLRVAAVPWRAWRRSWLLSGDRLVTEV